MTDEQIARVTHEANRALCAAQGDFSQPAWDDAPEWQRESAIAGVRMARENPFAHPIDFHASWSEQKIADGWRHGAVKDAEAKTHPCLVSYEDLPEEQRRKDHLFSGVARALLKDI